VDNIPLLLVIYDFMLECSRIFFRVMQVAGLRVPDMLRFSCALCNDPKPLCEDHHCFGVFSKTFSE
jgi:hypothetical protein